MAPLSKSAAMTNEIDVALFVTEKVEAMFARHGVDASEGAESALVALIAENKRLRDELSDARTTTDLLLVRLGVLQDPPAESR